MCEMVVLGVYKCDNGFKSDYLNHLEEMLKKSGPTSGIKAKPHIESKVKVLRNLRSIINDMILGIKHDSSDFGFDSNSNMSTAPPDIWDGYSKIFLDAKEHHKKSFPFYNDSCVIFKNDRATREDAVALENALEEVEKIDSSTESDY
ncbi:hypothetical protein Syun_009355 [Stephania yunnanensis]|uniref:Uncharacterized protein n=1 Tax=Stephania yunnanensis TaxID=152371 RepID=A0AAP0PS77_9MAGN